MSYSTIEAAVLATLRAYSGDAATFSSLNSSRGDYTVKDNVSSEPAAVVRQGGRSVYADSLADPRRQAHGKRQERHSILIDLFVPRRDGQGGDSVAYVACADLTDALIGHFNARPTLGGACTRCQVVAVEPPLFLEKLPHIAQRIVLSVDAETAIALASGEELR